MSDNAKDPSAPKEQQQVIRVLPPAIVDRIAAGEVVQRAAAAVKELCENSLDAGSDSIRCTVTSSTASLDSFSVMDNGSGISAADLPLACTRHATSKLTSVEDLNSIASFGFRGEALASISMVARVKIVSKTAYSQAAYQMQYQDGRPTTTSPTPTARTVGTTISVTDLFYNLPNRQRLRASEEYQAVLKVMQLYAIHYASTGVAMHCQKQQKTNNNINAKTDLNTSQAVSTLQRALASRQNDPSLTVAMEGVAALKDLKETATKQVIAQVFGSQLLPHLLEHSCELYETACRDEKKDDSTAMTMTASDSLIYSCKGFVTSPSYHQAANTKTLKKNNLILFVNHRLVDGCTALKRAVEDVYVDYCRQKPPLIYLALTVPPDTVDVNVHPTKREVALLHLNRICQHLAQQLKLTLDADGQSFQSQSVEVKENPYAAKKRKSFETAAPAEPMTKQARPAPKSMIRTSRSTQAGSLEPFLIQKTSQISQSQRSSDEVSPTPPPVPSATTTPAASQSTNDASPEQHEMVCPLRATTPTDSAIDLSLPGAFATAAARCTCEINKVAAMDLTNNSEPIVRLPRQTSYMMAAGKSQGLRLQKMAPTSCKYSSVKQLRKRVEKHRAVDLEKKLRAACFVGTVSHDRSLIQCGDELVMMNHHDYAQELFYQLALNRFDGGCGLAKLPGDAGRAASEIPSGGCAGIDIEAAIGQFVQIEETLQHTSDVDVESLSIPLKVSETNQTLAGQAGACLLQHAEMLMEYFSISIEKDDEGKIRLTGLPVLLEGYEPSPHGLPLFLLRLATEVDWTEEKPCFYGICRELGSYYAQLPSATSSDDHAAIVRHTIFPAVSTLLVPSDQTKSRDFVTLTTLPKLYRVFERC
jgi:DNA mismatch repair protein MLH1